MLHCIGKLFHRIIARLLEKFLLENHIIDSSIQKGFISGINGVIENILSLNSIIRNSTSNNLPLLIFCYFYRPKECLRLYPISIIHTFMICFWLSKFHLLYLPTLQICIRTYLPLSLLISGLHPLST